MTKFINDKQISYFLDTSKTMSFTVKGLPSTFNMKGFNEDIAYSTNLKPSTLEYNYDAPPLFLAVNPESIDIKFSQQVNQYQTLGGFVEEHWGSDMPIIDCSGITAGFYHTQYGYTTVFRRETESYKNFMNLVSLYRNNGCVYDSTGRVIYEGYIQLEFDNGIYLGRFTSFNYDESESKPYQFNYSFSFLVEETVYTLKPLNLISKSVSDSTKGLKEVIRNPKIDDLQSNMINISREYFLNYINHLLQEVDQLKLSFDNSVDQIEQSNEDLKELIDEYKNETDEDRKKEVAKQINILEDLQTNFRLTRDHDFIGILQNVMKINNVESDYAITPEDIDHMLREKIEQLKRSLGFNINIINDVKEVREKILREISSGESYLRYKKDDIKYQITDVERYLRENLMGDLFKDGSNVNDYVINKKLSLKYENQNIRNYISDRRQSIMRTLGGIKL